MITMIKGNTTKEVTDESLVSKLEQAGWERQDAPVKATLRKPKKEFTEVQEDESEEAVKTPAEEASDENAIN